MKRFFFICCVVLVFAFQAFVLSLVWQPRVNEEYRLYYIEKVLKCWPRSWEHADGLTYPVGEELDFSRPVVYLTRAGWGRPDSEGTTMNGSQAGLLFRWPGYAPTPRAVWTEWRRESAGEVGPLLLNVAWNGQTTGEWVLDMKFPTFLYCANLSGIVPDSLMRLEFRQEPETGQGSSKLRLRRLWMTPDPCSAPARPSF